jgi:probable biosynthetic protein (TIGR04098 family)
VSAAGLAAHRPAFARGDAHADADREAVARALPPEAPRRIRVGMPHLDAGGLSENWLFRDAGDRHWEAIARSLGLATDEIRSESGERIYPTVVAVRARYDMALSGVRENDLFEAAAEVVPCGRACAHGRVVAAIGGQRGRFVLELLTTFASRTADGSLRMSALEPRLARRWIPIGGEPAIARIARAARRGEPLDDPFAGPVMALAGPPLAAVDYEPSPYADYNGAGLLYFASYVTIADSAERRMVRHLGLDRYRRADVVGLRNPPRASRSHGLRDWALVTSAVRRDIFYYDNLPLGASLTAELLAFEEDCSGVTTRIRFTPSDDRSRPMADIVTRRVFVRGGR